MPGLAIKSAYGARAVLLLAIVGAGVYLAAGAARSADVAHLPPGVGASADVTVWRDDAGSYHATRREGETLASGDDFIDVAQAALDSLTEGRDWQEKVLVVGHAHIGPADERRRLDIPSYTVFDVAGVIEVTDTNRRVLPVAAVGASHIDIPRLTVRGSPQHGLLLRGVSHVRLGDIRLEVTTHGVRIDDRTGRPRTRSTDIQLDRLHVAMDGRGSHGFETFGVDRLRIGSVMGDRTGRCVVLLNDTRDATVGSVIGRDAGAGTGYATFRLANYNENVSVAQVVARGGGRGVFILSGSRDVTVGSVNLADLEQEGIFIEDAQNVHVGGGVIRNTGRDGVLVNSRRPGQGPGRDHPPAEGVNIANLRILDDREERRQPWGIHERGPGTGNNRYVNNDLRAAGAHGPIQITAATSVVRDNVGGGVAGGAVTLASGADPAARVSGVSSHRDVHLALRARPASQPADRLAWSHHFEYDPENQQWDLLFRWRHDPGEDAALHYLVDQHQGF